MEAGTAVVFAPLFVVADLQRPEIHHSFLVHKLYEADAVLEVLYAVVSIHGIGFETDGYAKPVTDGLFQGHHELDEETRSIFQRTAVLIIATVVTLFEELHRQAVVPAGNLNEIETRLLSPFGGQHIHPDEGLNIALIGNGGIDVALGKNIRRQPTGRSGNLSRLEPRRVQAIIPKLYAGQASMLVQFLAHLTEVDHIALIPEARQVPGIVVR